MTHTCLACGYQGDGVRMTLVEVPKAEQQLVEVHIVSAEDRNGVKGFAYLEVPERYASEPRCRDTAACRERAAAIELELLSRQAVEAVDAPKPPRADEVEGPTWLL